MTYGVSVTRSGFAALLLLAGWLLVSPSHAQFPAAPGTGPGLPETIEAIDSARVTTRILYVTAHPDDERASVLTYLARGLHADVALFSITRGEGGQNALGPEQAPQLGLIRTQELLAATRGYGVKLYFTRVRDFGYSKTPEETERIWGDQVLEDMVRVIRTFRPNIVINNWGGVHTGHGHHQASGILTPKAVKLAADSSYKLAGESGAAGIPPVEVWNPSAPVVVLDMDRRDSPEGYVLPLDEISPLYGKTWQEIGLDSFANHHTQGIAGFINSPFLRRPVGLVPEGDSSFEPVQLAEPLSALRKDCRAFSAAQAYLDRARQAVMNGETASGVQNLAAAAKELEGWQASCPSHPANPTVSPQLLADVQRVRQRIERALALAAGIQIKADADTSELVAGDSFHVTVSSRCRTEASCLFGPLNLALPEAMQPSSREGDSAKGWQFTVTVARPLPFTSSETYPFFTDARGMLPLIPEPPPLVNAQQDVTLADYKMTVTQPVTHVQATSTSVVRVPLRVVPAYTVAVEPAQIVEVLSRSRKPFDVFLRVHSYSTKPAAVTVGLNAPDGFKAAAPVEIRFDGAGDQYARLTVTPPAKLDAGHFNITAYARRGDEKFDTALEPLASMPTLLWSEPARCVVHAFAIRVPDNLRVGYVSAENEPIPDALKRLGISVELLDGAMLNFGDLSKYDAIVVGVRAYELRPELAGANKRLLDYASAGGTLVVQYNRDNVWDKLQPAPYPAKIGSPTPRITDEQSPIRFLKAADPLLNQPNKITQEDFEHWVQERGLYFWSSFDSRYTPLLAMKDPGETELNGGLVYAHYGKGTYIYTGLAFFRELPEGVPGAYRLFVNLLVASRATTR